MKRSRMLALAALLCLSLMLTACSPKEAMKSLILKTVTAMGLREESTDDDVEENLTRAETGGSVDYPEGMDTTDGKLVQQADGGTMYVAFNGIANRSTDYFVAADSSVTVTGYATTESTNENYQQFKIALWELSDDRTKANYVIGSTVYYTTDGSCYRYTVTGLTPGKRYKVNISYDSVMYYVTGGLKIEGLGSEELTTIENSANS